jgi:hypothetical protein
MHFKLAGLLFLIAGAYLAIYALVLAEGQHSDALSAQVFPLVAIFLAMTVRVLQAEKHHRERLRISEKAEKDSQLVHEQEQEALSGI